MRKSVKMLAVVAAAALAVSACGDDSADSSAATTAAPTTMSPATTSPATMPPETMAPDTMAPTTESMDAAGTIVDVAASTDGFSTLVAAVQAAGLVDTLNGEGPFTVFAPTDDAFAAALEELGMTADELLADTELLTSVLTYHVIAGEVPASQVVTMDGESVATVNGADVTIHVDGDTVMVNDATVTAADVMASNGIIHVIDKVLLPPT